MMKLGEFPKVYLIGSGAYGVIEILWRGYTHWTMVLTGGICFSLIYRINRDFKGCHIFIKSLIGSGMITVVEFFVGCIANKVFKMNVWDYSRLKLNIGGQVCLLYSFLWFLLCIPAMAISTKLEKAFNATK